MTSKICKIGCNISNSSQNHTCHPFFFFFFMFHHFFLSSHEVTQIHFYKWYLLVFTSLSGTLLFSNRFRHFVCCDNPSPPLPITHHVGWFYHQKTLTSTDSSLVQSQIKSASRQILIYHFKTFTLFPLAPHSACSLAARREVTRVPLHASPRIDSPGLRC